MYFIEKNLGYLVGEHMGDMSNRIRSWFEIEALQVSRKPFVGKFVSESYETNKNATT